MSIERTTHIAVAIGLFERMDDKTLAECFPTLKSTAEARNYLKALRQKGFEYVPSCDDVDEKGLCRGHHESPHVNPPDTSEKRAVANPGAKFTTDSTPNQKNA